MQDQPQNTFGQIEPIDDTAVSQVDEDPTQPVSITPWDLSSRSRDDVLISASGDGGRGRRAWLVTAAFVAMFGLGWVGGANWYRISNIETAFNPVAQKVASSRPIPDVETKSVAKTDGPVRKTTSATASQGIHLVAAPSRTASVVQANANPPGAPVQRETMVAVPETRPTTIEGWTVREVRGGTAILEGPDGVRMASRGDTIPGVGRIDSIVRWGSRWIVATANGLIATP
jgi:cytoskeletal protein RodZ